MIRIALLALWVAYVPPCLADKEGGEDEGRWPVLSRERIVLRTTLGDLVIALFPEAAPAHAAQILKLVRLGVYDGKHFHKVLPDFMVQISGINRRRTPLTAAQAAAIRPLKAEFNKQPHRYGTVTMARDQDNPDSAETSFLITLTDVPQMDGKFTVIGSVEMGHDVLEAIRRIPTDALHQPVRRIEIERAFVVDSPEALARETLRPAPAEPSRPPEKLPEWFALLMFGLGGIGALLSAISLFIRRSGVRAVGLACVLIAFFQAFVLFVPRSVESPYLAVGLLVGALGVMKAMTFFERSAA